jgi:uroporphyrin-III C-methyltransferase
MGKAAARHVSRELIDAGLAPDTPVAMVESASRADKVTLRTRLDLLAVAVQSLAGSGPALLLIGEALRGSTTPAQAAAIAAKARAVGWSEPAATT